MRAPVLFLAGLLLAAGCLGPADPGDGPAWAPQEGWSSPDDPLPVGGGHDHRDPAQHRFARNATIVAHASLEAWGRSEEVYVGAHAVALHAGRGLLAAAVHGPADGQNGFHLFDVSGPGGLEHVAYWDAGTPVRGDRTVVFSPDGGTVFLGFEGGARPGVAAINVQDAAAPHEVGFWDDPLGHGPHTLAAGEIGGRTHVFSLALGITILEVDGGLFSLVGRYVTNDELSVLEAARLLDPAASDPTVAASSFALRTFYGHDMWFFHDEGTGKDLLLVAYAYDGAKILDLSVPSAPLLQARWMPPKDTGHAHYTHSMTAERAPDGRLVAVVGSETFEPENQGIASPVWILDATDAVAGMPLEKAPEHLSTWRNPGQAPAGNIGLSAHFFRQVDGHLALSHYHGGVWVLDLRDADARAEPKAVAYILPVPDDAVLPPEDCCGRFDLAGVPMVVDVEMGPDGDLYAADLFQGITRIQVAYPA